MPDDSRSKDALRRFVWGEGDVTLATGVDESQPTEEDHGEPAPGYYLLFTDGNKNGAGPPMIGGLLMYRKNGRLREAPNGSFTKEVDTDSIDHWEYTALIEGIKLAKSHGVEHLRAFMDRHSVVDQVNGGKVAPSLSSLHAEVMGLIDDLDFRLSWIPREMNAEADKLARYSEG